MTKRELTQAGDDSAREGADNPKALSADMKGSG